MNCSVTFGHFLSCLCLCLFASKVELTLTALISYGCCEGSMWSLAMRATIVFRPVLTWGFGPRFFLLFSWVKKQKPRERKQTASLKNSPFLNGIFRSPGGRCKRWNCYDDAAWMLCPIVFQSRCRRLFHTHLRRSYCIRRTGRAGLFIPSRSHFTDQITEVLEDHTATKWSTWVLWLLMHLPLLFSSGYSSSL